MTTTQTTNMPIDRFDPLLRDLLTWGLIVRSTTGEASRWTLAEAAEERLCELAAGADPGPPEMVVRLGRRCATCQARRPTWLRAGVYICESCGGEGNPEAVPYAPIQALPEPRRPGLRWPSRSGQRPPLRSPIQAPALPDF
jgi:hypothetical protein